MNPLHSFDAFFITQAERFSSWTLQTFGLSAEFWERLFYGVTAATVIVITLPHDRISKMASTMVPLDYIVFGVHTFHMLFPKKRLGAQTEASIMDSDRLMFRNLRPLMLISAVVTIWADWKGPGLWFQCRMLTWYFSLCSIPPFSKSKVRVWLSSLFQYKSAAAAQSKA